MRKFGVVLVVGIFLVAVSLLPVAKHAAAAVDVEVGDYWNYEADTDVEGMSLSGTMKMKVTGTEGSGASEVFVIAVSGSGEVSGSTGGYTVSGSADYSGEIKRLKIEFQSGLLRFGYGDIGEGLWSEHGDDHGDTADIRPRA